MNMRQKKPMISFQLLSFLLNIDMFGAPVPTFNMRKQGTIKTSIGTVMSILIMGMTSIFALLKLQKLFQRTRPDVVSFTDEQAFDATFRYSVRDNGVMFAVSIENYLEGAKNDPRHIQWVA